MTQANGQVSEEEFEFISLIRSDLKHLKAVKFSEPELTRITKLQEWLAITRNPKTGQPFIPQNSFSALIQFTLNLTFRTMGAVAAEMAQAEDGQ